MISAVNSAPDEGCSTAASAACSPGHLAGNPTFASKAPTALPDQGIEAIHHIASGNSPFVADATAGATTCGRLIGRDDGYGTVSATVTRPLASYQARATSAPAVPGCVTTGYRVRRGSRIMTAITGREVA